MVMRFSIYADFTYRRILFCNLCNLVVKKERWITVLLSAALLDNFISEYTTSCKWCVVTVDDAINWSVVRLYIVYQSSLLFASVHRYSCQTSCQSLPWNLVFLF